jgi:predicted  nucleic acid-binding Zn-ribbon protein
MTEDERHAEKLERELDDMEEQSRRLESEIDRTRQDWERKKHDSDVPGAAGDPDAAEEELPPEADYTTRGD